MVRVAGFFTPLLGAKNAPVPPLVQRHRPGNDPAAAKRASIDTHRTVPVPEPLILLTRRIPLVTVVPPV